MKSYERGLKRNLTLNLLSIMMVYALSVTLLFITNAFISISIFVIGSILCGYLFSKDISKYYLIIPPTFAGFLLIIVDYIFLSLNITGSKDPMAFTVFIIGIVEIIFFSIVSISLNILGALIKQKTKRKPLPKSN